MIIDWNFTHLDACVIFKDILNLTLYFNLNSINNLKLQNNLIF